MAERRIGEMMAAQRDAGRLSEGGRPPEKTGPAPDPVSPPTLADAGINKHLADRARKMAAVPEPDFEGRIADFRARVEDEGKRVTTDLLAAGEMMAQQRDAGGMASGTRAVIQSGMDGAGGAAADPPAASSTLADAGISKHLADRGLGIDRSEAQRAMKIADIAPRGRGCRAVRRPAAAIGPQR